MDPHDPVFAELSARLPHSSWTRRMTAEEQKAFFRRALGPSLLDRGKSRRASSEEIDERGVFLAYRWCRWVLQGLGWGTIADPLSFVTEGRSHRRRDGETVWEGPVESMPIHLSSSTLPGIYSLRREIRDSPRKGLYLQPPRSSSGRRTFLATLEAGIQHLGFRQATPDHSELGLYRIDPSLNGGSGVWIDDGDYELFAEAFPKPEEILEFEQSFLTTLSEALTQTNEDELRVWMRQFWRMNDYEAFSVTQTAKAWSAAMRPIDVEVERRMQLRRLEGASERARLAGDHRAEIMASTQAARILGLAQSGPVDADEAAAAAALTAHEDRPELDGPAPSLEQWRESRGLPELRSVDDGPRTIDVPDTGTSPT